MYKNFLLISATYNVMICGRIFVYDGWALEWILPSQGAYKSINNVLFSRPARHALLTLLTSLQ